MPCNLLEQISAMMMILHVLKTIGVWLFSSHTHSLFPAQQFDL